MVDRAGRILSHDDRILVTGANGFIGSRVVAALVAGGFTRVRCLSRGQRGLDRLTALAGAAGSAIEGQCGNLLDPADCLRAVDGVTAVIHLAAGMGSKSFAGCYADSVVATRNLLDACLHAPLLRRFVNVSSLAVYSGFRIRRGAPLTESAPVERNHAARAEPYCYGKIKQELLVARYARDHGLPCTTVRLGVVFGPGKRAIPGRVGIDSPGIFLHLGGRNRLPLLYVDNCADALVASATAPGLDGKVFNVVDDDLPTSGEFLGLVKRRVGWFRSIRVPYRAFYVLNRAWERYAAGSGGQVPAVFNRRHCATYYQGQSYDSASFRRETGWTSRVPMDEALRRYCAYMRKESRHQ
jgi:nucleoside-diphosphate-sugar epimerase